jgi:fumarate reductase subunit D
MYVWTLLLHSWLRWFVIVAGAIAVGRALAGISGRGAWTGADDAAGKWFVVSLDVQLVIGLLLYGVLSPITRVAFADMGAAMADATLRFWAVEHLFLMVIAVVLAHIGRARSRRAATPARRHRAAFIFYGLAIVAVLVAIPWPFMAQARPLFRLG